MLTLKSNLYIEISYLVLFERESKLSNEKVTLLVKQTKKKK